MGADDDGGGGKGRSRSALPVSARLKPSAITATTKSMAVSWPSARRALTRSSRMA